ncbi:hypothetical protein BKA63DRAFT_112934 [Paraphoma chrysanthemicola]|nr:hypothetical protein BKA63DRAFT_112934 [Paraphoma chrysanthemicola]
MNTCKTCWQPLRRGFDTQRSGVFWKNCQRCRERNRIAKRPKQGRASVPRSSTSATPSTPAASRAQASFADIIHDLFPPYPARQSGSTFPASNTFKATSPPTTNNTPNSGPECSVCGDTFPSTHYPRLPQCTHEPRVCRGCLSDWLTSQVGTTSWNRIVCPSEGCNTLITHEQMKDLASQETYTRYDDLSTRSVLSAIPNFRHCLRAGCTSGQIHDSGVEGNIFRCVACAFLVCTTHDEAFHAGETCDEYDSRKTAEHRVADDASAERIAGTTKVCPGDGCGVRIEKNLGCDHMTCRRCYHEFCWQCLAPYRGPRGIYTVNNSMHERGCVYWTPALGAAPGPLPRERVVISLSPDPEPQETIFPGFLNRERAPY